MKINKYLIIRLIVFIIGITITFFIVNNNNISGHLFLIPLCYSILILIFDNIMKNMLNYIGLLALNIIMFMRYLIAPLMFSIEGIYSIRSIIPDETSYKLAINLMLYEMLVVMLLIQLLYKRFYLVQHEKIKEYGKNNKIIFFFICINIILLFLNPNYFSNYTFIFNAMELKKDVVGGEEVSSLVAVLIRLSIIVLPIYIINILYKWYLDNYRMLYVFSSIVIVVLFSSFIIGTSRFSVILPLVTGMFIIYSLFYKHRTIIIYISLATILFMISLTTILKIKTIKGGTNFIRTFFDGLPSTLDAYFAGVNNVAIAVETKINYPSYTIDVIVSDIFRSVPILNSLVGVKQSAFYDYNSVFYNGGMARDQILSTIGQGYLYFGFLLAPLFSLILTLFVMYFDRQLVKNTNVFMSYLYTYIALKFGLFMMFNFTNLFAFFTNNFLILFLVFGINSKIKLNKNNILFYVNKRIF